MLPFGWTVETLLGSHASKPYNPDIARVFYRAGYIENWGRGIQKIRDACKAHGAEEPEYIVHGGDIMVKFTALQSAIVTDPKGSNVTKDVTKGVSIKEAILCLIRDNKDITTTEMAESLAVNRRTIQRALDDLKDKGVVERKGGRRYGFWEILD
ncbi:MAG: ATP-binding protein [Saccharofermentanales bacterium]|jgi:ATP-dependent DNA helicase RecG